MTIVGEFIGKIFSTPIPSEIFLTVIDAPLCLPCLWAITIPSKTQSCLACGIPILLSADGEVKQIIDEAKCGVSANAGDASELAKAIHLIINITNAELNEMSNHALSYSSKHFNRSKLNNRLLHVFQESIR